ncbi:MAG: hypothetical protein Q9194_004302 [Teloschistes cf. exilis]
MAGRQHGPWSSWLEDKWAAFDAIGCAVPRAAWTDSLVRCELAELAKRERVKKIPQMHTAIFKSFKPVISLANDVDNGVQDPNGLVSLVWGASLVALKAGCSANTTLHELVKFFNSMNNRVPGFTTPLSRFALDPDVQKPVQDFFEQYMQTFMIMLTSISQSKPDLLKNEILKKHVEELDRKLEEARGRHEGLVRVAEQEEEKTRGRHHQPDHEHISQPLDDGREIDQLDEPKFSFIKRLGSGRFGEVHEVKELSTGIHYARKRILCTEDASQSYNEKTVLEEVKIMKKLYHQHITRVLLVQKGPTGYTFTMEPVAECNLLQYMIDCIQQSFPGDRIVAMQTWFGCLLEALSYAHSRGIRHNDIKPSNILIHQDQPYICDFGLAKDFTEEGSSTAENFLVTGTPVYFAPECNPSRNCNHASDMTPDVFALGCVFSEILSVCRKKTLEEYRNFRKTRQGMPVGPYGSMAFRNNIPGVKEWLAAFKPGIDKLGKRLINQITDMLSQDPDDRPSAEEARIQLQNEGGQKRFFC